MADSLLRVLSPEELDRIARIENDGSVSLDVEFLADVIASQLGLQNLHVAVSDADYLQ
ncbi:MAG: hypothetical protein RBS17_11310 [Coriobacteriia bacterium]|nr:hypothetical protein [Coriobacteriia bacterium]